jgi:hypothetical protein
MTSPNFKPIQASCSPTVGGLDQSSVDTSDLIFDAQPNLYYRAMQAGILH